VFLSSRSAASGVDLPRLYTNIELIVTQISEALSIMSKYEFPQHWPGLLPELVARMRTDDLHVLNGLMMTANSIFKRYELFSFHKQLPWT
jgi:exportin-2 (importin alpha re-exporter)